MSYPKRARRSIQYHSRSGKPLIHQAQSGSLYIMTRKRGGGTKRLYDGSKYTDNGRTRTLRIGGLL